MVSWACSRRFPRLGRRSGIGIRRGIHLGSVEGETGDVDLGAYYVFYSAFAVAEGVTLEEVHEWGAVARAVNFDVNFVAEIGNTGVSY